MRRVVVMVVLCVSACAARPVGEDAGVTTMAGESSTTDAHDGSSEVGPLTLGTTGDGDGDTGGDGDGDGDTGGDGDGDAETVGDGDGDDGCTQPRKLDLPPDFDNTPMPDSCTVEHVLWSTLEQYPGCELCNFDGACVYELYLGCVTPTPGQTCADICPSGDCLTSYWNSCEGPTVWDEMPIDTCGHYEIDGNCCTIGKFWDGCAE